MSGEESPLGVCPHKVRPKALGKHLLNTLTDFLFYSKLKVKIHEARHSIYKRECLGKQEKGKERKGVARLSLLMSMLHPRKFSRR